MANVVGLTLIKAFTYRDDPTEEWSNKYYFSGAEPADATAWKALADALIAQEKTLYRSTTAVVRAYGYWQDETDDSPSAEWSYDYAAHSASVPGTLSSTGADISGDQAAVLEWKTSRHNSKGKLIYLRKYYHGLQRSTDDIDKVTAGWLTAANAFGTLMFNGSFSGGRTIRSQRHAETITERVASPWITTRTLHRRGRRP